MTASTMPPRIFAKKDKSILGSPGVNGIFWENGDRSSKNKGTAYVRADIHEELVAASKPFLEQVCQSVGNVIALRNAVAKAEGHNHG